MKWLRIFALGALVCCWSAAPATAQYMYMDTNGDGVWSTADMLNPNGTPTTVSVYLDTSHNRDGSLAHCDSGEPDATLQMWNSYGVHVVTPTGTVTYSNYANQVPTFTIGCVGGGLGFASNTTEMSACQASGTPESTGGVAVKMFTMTVTGVSGTPSLQIVPLNSLDQNFTSFGTPCGGMDFDNTYKLGTDWLDVNGAGPAPGGNALPVFSVATTAIGTEGALFSITATATDTDASDVLTITATGQPSSLTLTTTPGVSPATATLSGTLGLDDQGQHTITWSVNDGHNPPVTATTTLTVTNTDQAPVVTAPATVSGAIGSPLSVTVTATDPDQDVIASFIAAPLPPGANFTANAGHTAGTLDWTPVTGQEGSTDITFTASNALSGSATTHFTIAGTGADLPPAVTAPATITGSEGTLVTFSVTAVDPDGDAITSLTGSPLPTGATFTANAGNTGGTFSWTPTHDQAGTYTVTWTASNALTGTGVTAITIENTDQPPVLAAIGDVTVAEGSTATVNVSATDPDGDPITLTATLPAFGVLNAPTTGTGSVATTITLSPLAGTAGSYTGIVTATAGALTDSKTFAITVTGAGADQAPTVTAPPLVSGTEGTLVTFTVTASDPNGDPITSLTAAPLPTGATFTANGANTSGTFSWTPSGTQAGAYDVTFTASNALSGNATTHLTIAEQPVDHAPVVTAPPTVNGTEGALVTFTVTANDPDGDAITSLTAAPLPSGATFTANGSNTSGTFSWTPTGTQSGTYDVTFTASNALSGSATTHITIAEPAANHPPVVTAPATQTVNEGQLLTFTVTATDADGDHVTLTATGVPSGATFTDNGNNTGTFSWTPGSSQSGSYTVTFTGNDGHGGTATATTVITVNDVTGGAFTATAKLVGNFNSHRRFLCFHIVPTAGSFDLRNVDLASVQLNFGGGSLTALSQQTHLDTDCDTEEDCEDCGTDRQDSQHAAGDCTTQLHACFLMSDVAALFGGSIPDNLASATITGTLTTGGTFTATIGAPRVAGNVNAKGMLKSKAKPNPLNPKTDLTFTLPAAGHVRVSLFDARGRLVKTLLDENRPAGENVVAWDGSDARGGHVSSGVYFFRVEAFGTKEMVRVAVLK